MNKKLTSKTYWENYYKNNHTEKQHILNVCSYYDDFWDLFLGQHSENKSIIEVGGFPGRYLAYLASKYNLKPTCLDYNSDVKQIEDSFKVMNVETYNILQEDFTEFQPTKQYEYVLSNGFIEHFENFEHMLDLHLNYLKPKGKLLIIIPNKRYLRKVYGYLCDYNNLKAHNLKCMNLKVFKDFSNRNNLKIKKLQFYGGFPFSVHQKLNVLQKIIFKIVRYTFKIINPFFMKHPSKYFSSTIIGIFEKQ